MEIMESIMAMLKRTKVGPDRNRTMSVVKPLPSNSTKHGSWRRSTSTDSGMMQSKMKKFARKLAECRVVSLPSTMYRANIESFARGTKGRIVLERDLINRFDKHAIRVIGIWKDNSALWHTGQIGWVPSEVTFKIAAEAPTIPVFADILKISTDIDIRGPHVQIAIWS